MPANTVCISRKIRIYDITDNRRAMEAIIKRIRIYGTFQLILDKLALETAASVVLEKYICMYLQNRIYTYICM